MKSPYQLLGIPDSVAWLCVGVALIFALAPYLAGLDFGIFKIPTFDDRGKRRLKWIGPILIILSMVLFIPLESLKPPIPQLHVLPQDLILNLKDPYTSHQTIVGVDIQIQLLSGSIGLTHDAKLLDQSINKEYFVSDLPKVELLNAKPSAPVVSAESGAINIKLEFNTSSLIPKWNYVTNYKYYIGHECGRVTVEITYKDGNANKSKMFPVVIRFGE